MRTVTTAFWLCMKAWTYKLLFQWRSRHPISSRLVWTTYYRYSEHRMTLRLSRDIKCYVSLFIYFNRPGEIMQQKKHTVVKLQIKHYFPMHGNISNFNEPYIYIYPENVKFIYGRFEPIPDNNIVIFTLYIKYWQNWKRHIQAEIIKKSLFLFWLLNMAIICEHVHRLELRQSLRFWVANVASAQKSPIYQLLLYFLFWTCISEIKFRHYFSLNWQMRNTNFKNLRDSSIWTC